MSNIEEPEDYRRQKIPYSAKNPIPTVSKYRKERAARQEEASRNDTDPTEDDEDVDNVTKGAGHPHGADSNRQGQDGGGEGDDDLKDTSEIDPGAVDPKQRLKNKKNKTERAEREVTDPVTHLPVRIQDFTDDALKKVDLDEVSPKDPVKTPTGLSAKSKTEEDLHHEGKNLQERHDFLSNRFPPPDFGDLRRELASITSRGVTFGLVGAVSIGLGVIVLERLVRPSSSASGIAAWSLITAIGAGAIWVVIEAVRGWISQRVSRAFESEVWEAHREQLKKDATKHEKETTVWLNSLLGAVWPLVNPDLFAGIGDMLEDVMQASLPKMVRMVSVDDIGQGSEAIRILGVRWLPKGAAEMSLSEQGHLTSDSQSDKVGGSGDDSQRPKEGSNGEEIAEGMEAEEGEFINLEVAFAYRTGSGAKSLKERSKEMHLYLAFYLIGNIKVPIWVDLQGIIGTMRLRLQLTPDPPFFALCTLTFLGQPKVDLSCVPLSKHGVNLMDTPLISGFVQSSIDAAMAEYVAPKSLTLDLKDMISGDDFKKDTNAKGVLMVHIKRGYDFKIADSSVPVVKDGGSDPYVSVGWAKFGKVLWSTRILISEMEPYWDETAFVLVTPEELNVEERLRIQLWDSDKFTADDDLGRIEVNLQDIISNKEASGRMWHRTDGFRALKSGDDMPGKLEWSVGYFPKTKIKPRQFEQQTHDPEVRNMDQLRKKVDESCERKLREIMFKQKGQGSSKSELEQQKAQELKEAQDAMIISAPPLEDYPSGVFSLQIHNITGLELEQLSKTTKESTEDNDEQETGEGLPSAYCSIIINHAKVYKTRTKPQNSKPFYNAGTERFIRDWTDCEVFVTVRDSRLDEDDPLLGIVHLPLSEVFQERSQITGVYPLVGGIGHGKVRLSMVWRSVELQAPRNLLGWELGTVEVKPNATAEGLPEDLSSCKLKLRTNIGVGKLYPSKNEGNWRSKADDGLTLAVQKRYSTCMSVAFKKKGGVTDSTAAFCVLWLKDVPDEEEKNLELPIWKGDFKRATSSCLEECGERVGTLKLNVTFWPGLGASHSGWASKDKTLREVVEVLDTARDNLDTQKQEKKAGVVDEEVSSDSDSSDDDDDIPDGSAGDKQNLIDRARDYKKREKRLHRQHRGLMQWKVCIQKLTALPHSALLTYKRRLGKPDG